MGSDSNDLAGQPIILVVKQHIVTPSEPIIAKVHATRQCTPSRKAAGFVRHIELDVAGTKLENSWHAGQSFGVIPPGKLPSGQQHKLRLYSIAAPTGGETGDGTILTTTVKRVIEEHWDTHELFQGLCSNYLCDLQVGDEVMLTGPVGKRFLLPENPADHDYLFIATGTGIAPFRSMILDLIKLGVPSRTELLMGVPYASDLLYHDELTQWVATHPNLGYRTAVSRHITHDQPEPIYVQDRLKQDFDELETMLRSERTLIYICGMAGMELGVFQTLARLLSPEELSQYLKLDPSIAGDIDLWERRMIPKLIKKTKRVFLEVY